MGLLLASLVMLAYDAYYWLIIVEVILSWIPRRHGEAAWLSSARDFVQAATEPYLGLFRRIIPIVGSGGVGLDLSPLIGLLVLWLLRPFVSNLVFRIFSLVLP